MNKSKVLNLLALIATLLPIAGYAEAQQTESNLIQKQIYSAYYISSVCDVSIKFGYIYQKRLGLDMDLKKAPYRYKKYAESLYLCAKKIK